MPHRPDTRDTAVGESATGAPVVPPSQASNEQASAEETKNVPERSTAKAIRRVAVFMITKPSSGC